MFKVVSEYCEKPHFLIVCDSRKCGASIAGDTDFSSAEKFLEKQTEFVNTARKSGWTVGLDGQLCSGHTKRMVEQAEAVAKLQQMPVKSDAPLVQIATQMPRRKN